MRSVRVTTVAVERKSVLNIMNVSVSLPWLSGTKITFFCTVLYRHQRPVWLLTYFSTLSLKLHDFREGGRGGRERVFRFSLQLLSETFPILRRIREKIYIDIRVKYQLFLSNFNGTWNFSDRFSKNHQIRNFMEILPVGTELFHAKRQTDGQTWRN